MSCLNPASQCSMEENWPGKPCVGFLSPGVSWTLPVLFSNSGSPILALLVFLETCRNSDPHTLPTLSTSAILHLPHCPHSIHFKQNPSKHLVRGRDTEWKISAQMAEGKVAMDKQEGRDGENCQVSQQQPKHHLHGKAGLGSATPLCDTAPTPKSPGTGENASSKGL